MDLLWLRVFREVAKSGSFTAAAEPLGFTQSAVSRQISALEQEIGVPLFDRLPRGVRLTAQGRSLLGHAEAVLDRMSLARRDLQALADLAFGRIAVGAFSTAEVALVPRALAAFTAAYPGVVVELSEGLSGAQLDRVRAGRIDLAVVSSTAGPALETSQVELHHLLDEPMLVALPADHPLANQDRPLTLAELAAEDWIAGSSRLEETLFGAPGPLEPRIRWVAKEWTAKLGLVAAGLGATLVPALAAPGVRRDVHLAALAEGELPFRPVYAATARGATPAPATTAFLDMLHQSAEELGAL